MVTGGPSGPNVPENAAHALAQRLQDPHGHGLGGQGVLLGQSPLRPHFNHCGETLGSCPAKISAARF
jgi:hypothetical protein